jgi:hypothetical protein
MSSNAAPLTAHNEKPEKNCGEWPVCGWQKIRPPDNDSNQPALETGTPASPCRFINQVINLIRLI